jgi:histidinol-phosphate aminotransferase
MDKLIPLDRNENPYGPSSKVRESILSAAAAVNRYPGSEPDDLISMIARSHEVKPEQILVGCGSTELLHAAATAFLGPGKKLVTAAPTFDAMAEYARSVGTEVVALPLTTLFAHDLGAMREHVDNSTGLVYICNPNNPTGSLTPRRDIEAFVAKLPLTTHVVIDEAYHHYAGKSASYSSFIDQPIADDRVIVTRTFSHIYGLAGLRVGYAVAAPKSIGRLRAQITRESVNALAAYAAIMAIQDTAGTAAFMDRNENDRQEFFNQASGRMLKPIDSHANFVMMDAHMPADQVIQHFRNHGILLGPMFSAMPTYIRVSLGTAADMIAFWRAWDLLPVNDMKM